VNALHLLSQLDAVLDDRSILVADGGVFVATTLRRTDYHDVARGYGAEGFIIKTPEDICKTLRKARQAAARGRPVVINVWIDKTDFRTGSISM